MPLQADNNPDGTLALFDEMQEEILRLWMQQETHKEPAALSSQSLQTRSAELAMQKVASQRQYINKYLRSDHAEFEAFLLRATEMVYDVRKDMMYDVHAHLKIESRSGWPVLKIRLKYTAASLMVDRLTAATKDFIWTMAEPGAPELPEEVRICWKLRALDVADELEFCWGDEPSHFGWLDLGKCLQDFPRCSLDLGLF
ncbi:hypothetical protein F5Y10DRAFT_293079 [Nemania abortiva]|nr:hypothetical protein F5Y10DRAFT_293079 [Nemania abortiva]